MNFDLVKRELSWIIVLGGLVASLIIIAPYDVQILIAANLGRPRILDGFFAFYTDWGNYLFGLMLIIFIAIGLAFIKQKKFNWLIAAGVLGLLSFIIADLIVTNSLKVIINRPRPMAEDFYALYGLEIVGADPGLEGSFPSGHATSAFALAMPFAVILWKKFAGWKKYLLSGVVSIFAILMAFSRVYCSVHYPTDVIAGAIVGIGISWLLIKTIPRVFPKLPGVEILEK
ncbi:MAG: phosphatase PAP2 family protein [Candidatus Korarchaeota archaeon]